MGRFFVADFYSRGKADRSVTTLQGVTVLCKHDRDVARGTQAYAVDIHTTAV